MQYMNLLLAIFLNYIKLDNTFFLIRPFVNWCFAKRGLSDNKRTIFTISQLFLIVLWKLRFTVYDRAFT